MSTPKRADLTVVVPLDQHEREKLSAVCGPRRPWKRGAWVRAAIIEKLERDEARTDGSAK